jgi:hypothetical protein
MRQQRSDLPDELVELGDGRSAVTKYEVVTAGKIVLVILGNNQGLGRSAGKVLHAEIPS